MFEIYNTAAQRYVYSPRAKILDCHIMCICQDNVLLYSINRILENGYQEEAHINFTLLNGICRDRELVFF